MAHDAKEPVEERSDLPKKQEASLADELQKMEYEPLLPVEKKLIAWSLGIGVVALGLLVWVSYTFFLGGR
jgi:hypothetical protein